MRKKDAIEKIAALVHEVWIGYSKGVVNNRQHYSVHPHKMDALQKLWIPYENLDEIVKDIDREIAERYYKLFKEIQK